MNFGLCFLSCIETGNDASFENVTCGDVNNPDYPWSGVIMKSTCSLNNRQGISNCQSTVQRLHMALEKELPVFDLAQNVIYRSIACARCNNVGNMSFWGLEISCRGSGGSFSTPVNITIVKKFLKERPDCSWRYAPRNGKQQHKSCVLHAAPCDTNPNHLPVLSVVKELCSLYSMVFLADYGLKYRNPHCALCNPDGRSLGGGNGPSVVPPLSILLDVSGSIPDPKEPKHPLTTLITGPAVQDYNLTSQVVNCISNTTNCTVTVRDYNCENFTAKNQSTQIRFSLNKSHDVILISPKQFLQDKNEMKLQGNSVYILCQENQTEHRGHGGQAEKEVKWQDSAVLIFVTLTGTLLSIISLCFMVYVYC